jgi:hypothetical protein
MTQVKFHAVGILFVKERGTGLAIEFQVLTGLEMDVKRFEGAGLLQTSFSAISAL